jgi:hypothetical protein
MLEPKRKRGRPRKDPKEKAANKKKQKIENSSNNMMKCKLTSIPKIQLTPKSQLLSHSNMRRFELPEF